MDSIVSTSSVRADDIEKDNRSIYVWLDLLGFSEYVNDESKYKDLADLLKKFQSSFNDSHSYVANIISDGIILRITKSKLALAQELESIFMEIADKQFKFIKENEVFIRGGIAVGTKLEDKDDKNSLYISNGLAKAVKLEGSYVNWPIIGTSPNVLADIRDFLNIDEDESFGLKKAFNVKGQDLYFIDFISPNEEYYKLLDTKMEIHKEEASIRNKYLWLLRYYHHSCVEGYKISEALEKVVL